MLGKLILLLYGFKLQFQNTAEVVIFICAADAMHNRHLRVDIAEIFLAFKSTEEIPDIFLLFFGNIRCDKVLDAFVLLNILQEGSEPLLQFVFIPVAGEELPGLDLIVIILREARGCGEGKGSEKSTGKGHYRFPKRFAHKNSFL